MKISSVAFDGGAVSLRALGLPGMFVELLYGLRMPGASRRLDNAQNGAHYIRDHRVDDVGHDRRYYTPGYDQRGQGKEGPNSGWQIGDIGFHNHVLGSGT
jgi:hypothetical protein